MKITKLQKNVVCLSLSMFLASSLAAPRSHAVVGLLLANAPLAIAGAVILGGSAALEGYAIYEDNTEPSSEYSGLASILTAFITIPGGITGLILLDGKAGQTVQYRALNPSDAASLGVTQDQISSYNANLDDINDALTSVEFDLAQQKAKPTLADSQAAWQNEAAGIPADALAVAAKVSAKAFQKR